jgi:transcriptional regulator with XRE-family HTH domain
VSTDELSLGAALREWRNRLPPGTVGLPARRSGRTPGLRREDLAELAGLSVDYVVRLEQGRATAPSAQVVASLARALQLTGAERDHLYRLSGLLPPASGLLVDHVPPGMQRILARLGDAPAGVFAGDWRMIWWNRGWAALVGDPGRLAPEDRSLVRSRFPVPGDEETLSGWPIVSESAERTDRAIVADLRRVSATHPDDPRLARLIRRTLAGNPRFAEVWHEGVVGGHTEDRKTVRHPVVGDVTVDCDVLTDTETDLKIVVYTAVDAAEESKMQLALMAGPVDERRRRAPARGPASGTRTRPR